MGRSSSTDEMCPAWLRRDAAGTGAERSDRIGLRTRTTAQASTPPIFFHARNRAEIAAPVLVWANRATAASPHRRCRAQRHKSAVAPPDDRFRLHDTHSLRSGCPEGTRDSGDTYENSCAWSRNIPRITVPPLQTYIGEGPLTRSTPTGSGWSQHHPERPLVSPQTNGSIRS